MARLNGHFIPTAIQSTSRVSRRRLPWSPVASSSRVTLDAESQAVVQAPHAHPPAESTTASADLEHESPKVSRVELKDLECLRMLGDGGWAEVYLVHVKSRTAPESGAFFAMKTISKRIFRDTERNDPCWDRALVRSKTHAERRILSKLPWNPFVAGLLDAYMDPRNTYLLLELAPSGSVLDHVERTEGLPFDDALFYFSNLILGIEFLHSQGIIHRDIKTDNVLVGADGYAMITDFGVAQYVHEGNNWARSGTTTFQSPEVLNDDTNLPAARYAMDWWAAGVTFFDMLMNHLPFDGAERSEVLASVQAQKVTYLSKQPARVQQFFQDVFMYDLDKRLGSRSMKQADGTLVNVELRKCPLFDGMKWHRIAMRVDPAPFVPDPTPDPAQGIHTRPMPKQKRLPEIRVKRPPPLLEYDAFRAEAERARKRRRIAEDVDEVANDRHTASTVRAEA
ncbi:kinase-like protein [Ganoderma leucocontextum]|nr:kinase-like protein [Ganoderma leucocontextum]